MINFDLLQIALKGHILGVFMLYKVLVFMAFRMAGLKRAKAEGDGKFK